VATPLHALGGDVQQALQDVNVPSYIIGPHGTIRWLNDAAKRIFGNVVGSYFLDIVSTHDRRRAQEAFTGKILGGIDATDAAVDLVGVDGQKLRVEVSSVPLKDGDRVIGVFGLTSRPPTRPRIVHPHLTPRQSEVLGLLAHGVSTAEMASELHLSRETVRNHVRGVLAGLGVHSRVEAVAVARASGLLDD
jgi:PAS domain S-box-containing protein